MPPCQHFPIRHSILKHIQLDDTTAHRERFSVHTVLIEHIVCYSNIERQYLMTASYLFLPRPMQNLVSKRYKHVLAISLIVWLLSSRQKQIHIVHRRRKASSDDKVSLLAQICLTCNYIKSTLVISTTEESRTANFRTSLLVCI